MRKDTYRVESEAVQGVGSWVECKQLMRGQWRELYNLVNGKTVGTTIDEDLDHTDAIIAANVVATNWTDSDGEKMVVPLDMAKVGTIERNFLLSSLLYPPAATKN